VDDALLELLFVDLIERHDDKPSCERAATGAQKLEARFARGLGEGAHAPVVEVAVAIEDDLGRSLRLADLSR
jgi:hypothetical protein